MFSFASTGPITLQFLFNHTCGMSLLFETLKYILYSDFGKVHFSKCLAHILSVIFLSKMPVNLMRCFLIHPMIWHCFVL